MPGVEICRTIKWTLAIGATLLIALPARAWQQDMQNMKTTTDATGHVCDDMGSSAKSMTVMGASMGAMTNHMCITPCGRSSPATRNAPKRW